MFKSVQKVRTVSNFIPNTAGFTHDLLPYHKQKFYFNNQNRLNITNIFKYSGNAKHLQKQYPRGVLIKKCSKNML